LKHLIILVGSIGAGKSTYCNKYPDYFRINQDDLNGSKHLVAEAFANALLTKDKIIIDRTNFNTSQRDRYTVPAKKAGYVVDAHILFEDFTVCYNRVINRKNHPSIKEGDKETALRVLRFFKKSYERPTLDEFDNIIYANKHKHGESDWYMRDLSYQRRPAVVIGDIHGCYDEMMSMLRSVPNYDLRIAVGDLCDKGPKIDKVLKHFMLDPNFYSVMGNHDWKLLRYLRGNKVNSTSLKATIEQISDWNEVELFWLMLKLEEMTPIIKIRHNTFIVHAGIKAHRSVYNQNFQDMLYIRSASDRGLMNDPNSPYWFEVERRFPKERIIFGHNADVAGIYEKENVVGLDSGCVYGDKLTGILRRWAL